MKIKNSEEMLRREIGLGGTEIAIDNELKRGETFK